MWIISQNDLYKKPMKWWPSTTSTGSFIRSAVMLHSNSLGQLGSSSLCTSDMIAKVLCQQQAYSLRLAFSMRFFLIFRGKLFNSAAHGLPQKSKMIFQWQKDVTKKLWSRIHVLMYLISTWLNFGGLFMCPCCARSIKVLFLSLPLANWTDFSMLQIIVLLADFKSFGKSIPFFSTFSKY